jgi:hypothetical protein
MIGMIGGMIGMIGDIGGRGINSYIDIAGTIDQNGIGDGRGDQGSRDG